MHFKIKKYQLIITLICIFFFSACNTIERQYETKRSTEESNVILTEKSDKNGNVWTELTSDILPGIKIIGEMGKNEEGFYFLITGAELFSNWNSGWTDAEYEASGMYLFKADSITGYYTCRVVDPFELWDITRGEIRYKNTYYRGNNGIWKVKNRIDRIQEITRWMHDTGRFAQNYGDLKDDIEPFLFPEVSNFKKLEEKKLLPQEYYDYYDGELSGKETRSNGFLWRMDYTAAVFPSEFHDLRNSGTIWRDYEEAPELFISFYNINYFFEERFQDQIFNLGEK